MSARKTSVYGTLHGPGYSGGGGIGGAYRADVNLDDGFHVYAIDWDPYVIRWCLDGELTNLVSVNALDGKQWIYDHDFFLADELGGGRLLARLSRRDDRVSARDDRGLPARLSAASGVSDTCAKRKKPGDCQLAIPFSFAVCVAAG